MKPILLAIVSIMVWAAGAFAQASAADNYTSSAAAGNASGFV